MKCCDECQGELKRRRDVAALDADYADRLENSIIHTSTGKRMKIPTMSGFVCVDCGACYDMMGNREDYTMSLL